MHILKTFNERAWQGLIKVWTLASLFLVKWTSDCYKNKNIYTYIQGHVHTNRDLMSINIK